MVDGIRLVGAGKMCHFFLGPVLAHYLLTQSHQWQQSNMLSPFLIQSVVLIDPHYLLSFDNDN